jgi:hypothetical protein
VTRI